MGPGTLTTTIDEMLALDPTVLTDAEVHEWVIDGQRQMSRMVAFNAAMLTQWESRKLWANDGSRSPGARLAREANLSKESADRAISRARNLRQMPHTAGALATGDVSTDHVDLLARANSGCRSGFFTDHEETLVEQCTVLRFADCRRMVDYWRQHADADAGGNADDDLAPHERRTASTAKTLDGTIDLRSGNERSTGQRRADALVEMAHRSRTAREGGLRPRPLITVLVGEDSFKHLCELSTGVVIKPGQIVPWLSDADVEAVLFEGRSRVLGVTYKRTFTGAVRRAVEVRDRRCQHPSGCDEPASRCDVDHIVPHSEGGVTSQDNGRLSCPAHNRDHTKRNLHPKPPPPPPTDEHPPAEDPGTDQPDQRPPPPADG